MENLIIGGNYTNKFTEEDMSVIENIRKNGEFIDYDANPRYWEAHNIKNYGEHTYFISPCSPINKYSLRYCDCGGCGFFGRDKKTGNNVSILTHQNPESFLNLKGSISKEQQQIMKKDKHPQVESLAIKSKKEFEQDLNDELDKLLASCYTDSIEAFIFGGDWESDIFNYRFFAYIYSIKFLSELIEKKLGKTPTVLTGPKDSSYRPADCYISTSDRKIYLDIEGLPNENFYQSYPASDIKKQSKLWVADWLSEIERLKRHYQFLKL